MPGLGTEYKILVLSWEAHVQDIDDGIGTPYTTAYRDCTFVLVLVV